MASITIRKLDETTKQRLRVRAAHHKRSMEDEARNILRIALDEQPEMPSDLGRAIHARFKSLGGLDLSLPVRQPMREPPRPRTR